MQPANQFVDDSVPEDHACVARYRIKIDSTEDKIDASTHFDAAEAYSRLGKVSDAVIALKRARCSEPRNVHIWSRLSAAFEQQGRYSEAAEVQ